MQLAIGLVGVLVGGLITAAIQWFVTPSVQRRIREQQRIEEGIERDQARKLSAWAIEVRPVRMETDLGVPIAMTGSSVLVRVRNGSEEPVYDAHVWVRSHYGTGAPMMGSHEQILIPPGESEIWVDGVELSEGGLAGMPFVELTFRDAGERLWQRTHDGVLMPDQLSPAGLRRRARA